MFNLQKRMHTPFAWIEERQISRKSLFSAGPSRKILPILLLLLLSSASLSVAQTLSFRDEVILPANPPIIYRSNQAEAGVVMENPAKHPEFRGLILKTQLQHAFNFFRRAEQLKSENKIDEAIYYFAKSLSELIAIQKSDPDYEPGLLKQQISRTQDKLGSLLLNNS